MRKGHPTQDQHFILRWQEVAQMFADIQAVVAVPYKKDKQRRPRTNNKTPPHGNGGVIPLFRSSMASRMDFSRSPTTRLLWFWRAILRPIGVEHPHPALKFAWISDKGA